MPRSHPRLALALAAFLWTLPAPSLAGGPAPTQEQVKQAKQAFDDAVKRIKTNDFAGAEPKLLEAMKLNPTYDVAVNLGQVQYRLAKYRDAAEHLGFALNNWPLVTDKKARDLAESRLNEVRAFVVSIRVTASVEGADVAVDGKSVGRAPLAGEIFLDPGPHEISASFPGYSNVSVHVDLAKGKRQDVALNLAAVAAPAPSSSAMTPVASSSAAPPTPSASPSVEPRSSGPSAGLIVASAIGTGVFLGVGIGMTVVAGSKSSEASSLGATLPSNGCSAPSPSVAAVCKQISDDAKGHDTFATIGAVGLVAAGALGVTTAVLLIWNASSGKGSEATGRSRGLHAAPWASPSSGGVSVHGVW